MKYLLDSDICIKHLGRIEGIMIENWMKPQDNEYIK
jgi:hypothetical protein